MEAMHVTKTSNKLGRKRHQHYQEECISHLYTEYVEFLSVYNISGMENTRLHFLKDNTAHICEWCQFHGTAMYLCLDCTLIKYILSTLKSPNTFVGKASIRYQSM